MSTVSTARDWLNVWHTDVEQWRGNAQAGMIAYRIAAETGCDPLAVASDPRLIECGWAQAPLEVAYKRGADPFDQQTAVWLACWMEHTAATKWVSIEPGIAARPRDIMYVAALDYSVGGPAVKRLLVLAGMHGTVGESYEERIRWVVDNVDLDLPRNHAYWPRQGGAKVKQRVYKKSVWCDEAEKVSPTVSSNTVPPPSELPEGCLPFPVELVNPARVVANRSSTTDECKAAWKAVRAYAKRTRTLLKTPMPSLTFRAVNIWRRMVSGPRGG